MTLLIAVLFSAPTAFVLARYVGDYALSAMVLTVFIAFTFAMKRARRQSVSGEPMSGGWLAFLAGIFCALSVAFYFVYPVINAQTPGHGSDRDDALNVAVSALLRSHFP